MADDIELPGTGATVATDDIGGGRQAQLMEPLGISTGDFWPNPFHQRSFTDPWSIDNLRQDSEGNLSTRGAVTTDEGSFRDDFTGSALATTISGDITTNGTATVTGTGFLSNGVLKFGHYIKVSSHAETALARIARILSDTELELENSYSGASTTAAGSFQNYGQATGTGGSFSVASSVLSILSGTTTTSTTYIFRESDYGPMIGVWACSLSQRIANQTGYVGFQDALTAPTQYARFAFDGTSNTVVKCQTAFSTAASDIEETTVTLPSALTTASTQRFKVELRQDLCMFWINETPVAVHRLHLPDPYRVLFQWAGWLNGGSSPASTSTLALDMLALNNFDVVNPANISPTPTIDYDAWQVGEMLYERVSDTSGNATNSTVFGATATARNVITGIVVYNDSTTNGFIDFLDGSSPGTILLTLPLPAKGGAVYSPPRPIRQPTINNAFRFDVNAALTTVYVSLQGFKSKI